MKNPPVRRFGISDGLILVGATCFGLAGIRFLLNSPGAHASIDSISASMKGSPSSWTVSDTVEFVVLAGLLLGPCLITWTLACLALRGRGSWPISRRWLRTPGTLACAAATVTVFLAATGTATIGVYRLQESHTYVVWTGYVLFQLSASIYSSAAVSFCWATLWLCGRWRPERSWLDRLGRLLGIAWIACGTLSWLFLSLQLY